MTFPIRIRPCGDRAAVVELGRDISPETLARVLGLKTALAQRIELAALVPGYASLFVEYDPLRVSFEELCLAVEAACPGAGTELLEPGPPVTIPVCYDPRLGPDLLEIARARGLSAGEVAEVHARPVYRVYLIGFTPGFAFLGGLDPRLAVPRLAEPRTHVAPGSVGIGGRQTGVYAVPSPGGWRLIGRTPLKLFDASRADPTRLHAGDRVRFEAIDLATFRRLGGEA